MEYDICDELKEVYKDNIFDSKTLRYRLKSFFDACNFQLEEGKIEELGFKTIVGEDKIKYCRDILKKKNNTDDYELIIERNISQKLNWLRIGGRYSNISFVFDNYYKRRIQNKDICNIPFSLEILLKNSDITYRFSAHKEIGAIYYFISKCGVVNDVDIKTVNFFMSNTNFEFLLIVLMNFLENPDYTIDAYSKKVIDNGLFFKKGNIFLENDVIIDEKGKKFEKVIKWLKIIIDNDR